MPISRQEKEAVIEMLKERLQNSQVVILADYRGLDVAAMNKLRRKMQAAESEFKVVKNTLTKRVAHEIGLEGLDPFLEGPTAIATCVNDPVAPAKVLKEIAKEHKELEIKAGVLEGSVVDVAAIQALADLPSREVLLAQVARGMQAPLTGFAGALQALLRNFAYALEAIRKQKAGESAG